MDPKDHKRLADNAYNKAVTLLEQKELSMDLLDFAHGARLHYSYSSFDPNEQEVKKNIEKTDHLLKDIYSLINIFDLL